MRPSSTAWSNFSRYGARVPSLALLDSDVVEAAASFLGASPPGLAGGSAGGLSLVKDGGRASGGTPSLAPGSARFSAPSVRLRAAAASARFSPSHLASGSG